jgi:hypothetical protein
MTARKRTDGSSVLTTDSDPKRTYGTSRLDLVDIMRVADFQNSQATIRRITQPHLPQPSNRQFSDRTAHEIQQGCFNLLVSGPDRHLLRVVIMRPKHRKLRHLSGTCR